MMNIKPIAHFRSPFPDKFGIPRQAGLVPGLEGEIVFEPEFRNADAVRGLEGFDYIWLIWGFSGNGNSTKAFQPTVRPPRLGGNIRIGVFASRSPFRPNGLGLSSVRLTDIRYDAKGTDGKSISPVLKVAGADLMDGTPVYDIKPYIEYTDSHPGIRSGFVDSHRWKPLHVVVTDDAASENLDWKTLKDVLAQDPRPQYQDNPDKLYGMTFGCHDIMFKVTGDILRVVSVKKL